MDATLRRITDFAFQLEYDDLTPEAIHECKRRLIDSIGGSVWTFALMPD